MTLIQTYAADCYSVVCTYNNTKIVKESKELFTSTVNPRLRTHKGSISLDVFIKRFLVKQNEISSNICI